MLTKLLIAANVIVFAYEWFTGATTSNQVLLREGAMYGPAVAAGEWWRLFTAAFLHANLIHIATNMIALYMVGTFIEFEYGRVRMTILYLLSMIGSGLACFWFAYDAIEIGASGAIFGLFGALLAAGVRWGPRGRDLVRQSSGIIIVNLVLGFTVLSGVVSNAAHVGGLLVGFLAGMALFRVPPALVPVGVAPLAEGVTYESPEAIAQAHEAHVPEPAPVHPAPHNVAPP